ncbi:uncharacterized protein MONBRDRAFT_7349 [Monosiga brevicollis MX1]|uniref:Uncharacterized protein n=1 Tax=Monosiga brevicollis TaxID=81824 RepID=A9UWP7_MONBE|nr:uncharacterized protein MONBRDRAFT_7349 [Monosiga brevicollis MX1]EDQ90081.1 predicted protein [Monosiga brevicollis MX1]|eukprot:XP_001744848.1 hypothetical protein [Monosiga brevicollis MX1]
MKAEQLSDAVSAKSRFRCNASSQMHICMYVVDLNAELPSVCSPASEIGQPMLHPCLAAPLLPLRHPARKTDKVEHVTGSTNHNVAADCSRDVKTPTIAKQMIGSRRCTLNQDNGRGGVAMGTNVVDKRLMASVHQPMNVSTHQNTRARVFTGAVFTTVRLVTSAAFMFGRQSMTMTLAGSWTKNSATVSSITPTSGQRKRSGGTLQDVLTATNQGTDGRHAPLPAKPRLMISCWSKRDKKASYSCPGLEATPPC